MRELSRREFYMLLIVPGLLIAGIYYFALEGTARAALIQAQQSVAVLQKSDAGLDQSISVAQKTPVPDVAGARLEAAALTSQLEIEKRVALANAHPSAMLPARWTSVEGRIKTIWVVESTLREEGLIVLSQKTEGESGKMLPKELSEFAAAAQTDGNHPVPEVWRISLVGSYDGMLRALEALKRADVFVVPLAADMKILPDDPSRRIWSLWIWI